MKWKEFVKDYLSFSRKERIGILIISGLILCTFFLPKIVTNFSGKDKIPPDTSWFNAVKKIEQKVADSSADYFQKPNDETATLYQYDKTKDNYSERNIANGELFYFDPNTLSESGWKKLGLRDKTIQTVRNYLNKGGHFYKPEDLQKIYGLQPDEYSILKPFIKIELTSAQNEKEFNAERTQTVTQNFRPDLPRYSIIDVNTADTSAFISLHGIGSKLSVRIVNFRDKLGGFYAIEQVGETYGLPDSTFQKIKPYLKLENTVVKKININTASIDELKSHPYIKYNLANPIVSYRNSHGFFSTVEDIKKVMAVTEEIYKKISPYLITQ